MRKFLSILAVAGLMTVGAGAASAQGVDVRIGVGERAPQHRMVQERHPGPQHMRNRGRVDHRVHRGPRMRQECRTVMRRQVRPNGMVVRRPVQVCRQVPVGRR
ncbi:hypothetical protein [Microvirga antarctica]|uniref:hypothetical protein n=1 Tax=Microvirga antarctica TaxID=2819233 RepID=UPI001B314B93|nr:hypothetical protein [Microvirga antarctica]